MDSSETTVITREEKEQALERLLRSGIVREHTNLYALLNFLGRRSLDGPPDALKEYTIGIEALSKPPDYDPRLDATVRVDISKLRTKLNEAYQRTVTPGAIRLEIPKGQYDIVYTRIPHAPLAPPVAEIEPAPPASRTLSWRSYAALGGLVLLLAGAIGYALNFAANRTSAARAALAPEMQSFWQPYLQSPTPTLLVFGTPMFVKFDSYLYREPRLNRPEEIETDEEVRKIRQTLGTSESRPTFKFTGVGEAEGIFVLTRLLTEQRAPLSVQRSNNLSWDDLKNKNVIVLGSQKYNPQIPKLPHTPKFEADRGRVTNLAPRPGEPAEYHNVFKGKHGDAIEIYALISSYPGLSPQTRLMILACSSNEGTGAAAEYVTHADNLKELSRRLRADANAPWPLAYQVVLKVKLNDGVPIQTSYVKHHIIAQ